MHAGTCLCGGIQFNVAGPLPPIQVCHCVQCQRAQGSAFVAVLPIRTQDFQLQSGAELMASFESSPGKFRCFCRTCGSPVFSRRESLPEVIRLRVGLLTPPVVASVGVQAYTAERARWWPAAPETPCHQGAAP